MVVQRGGEEPRSWWVKPRLRQELRQYWEKQVAEAELFTVKWQQDLEASPGFTFWLCPGADIYWALIMASRTWSK